MRLAIVALSCIITLLGCAQRKSVATGPFAIGATPRVVKFAEPVGTRGDVPRFCLDFDPPGGSNHAREIRLVAIKRDGRRETWTSPLRDRTGESVICFSPSPGSQAGGIGGSTYTGLELSSSTPIVVHRVLWGGAR